MSSQSLIFEGALHLCFAVSERSSEIPSCYTYYDCFEKVLSFEIYYYGLLVDYAIDMSNYETLELLQMWLVMIYAENLNAGLT